MQAVTDGLQSMIVSNEMSGVHEQNIECASVQFYLCVHIKYIILYYIILYYIILYYIILYYIILYYIILYYVILYYIISYYIIFHYILLFFHFITLLHIFYHFKCAYKILSLCS